MFSLYLLLIVQVLMLMISICTLCMELVKRKTPAMWWTRRIRCWCSHSIVFTAELVSRILFVSLCDYSYTQKSDDFVTASESRRRTDRYRILYNQRSKPDGMRRKWFSGHPELSASFCDRSGAPVCY